MADVKPTIYMLEREIHMIGDSVAVVWNTKPDKKTLVKDGVKYTAQVRVRAGNPYIDFVTVREYRGNDGPDFVEDDNSPIEGGLSAADATAISKELTAAVEYLKSGTWKDSK